MRISDWSSDVCSSDLPSVRPELVEGLSFPLDGEWKNGPSTSSGQTDLKAPSLVEHDHRPCGVALLHLVESIVDLFERYRSEERRVGKGCVRTCRSRWSPYH